MYVSSQNADAGFVSPWACRRCEVSFESVGDDFLVLDAGLDSRGVMRGLKGGTETVRPGQVGDGAVRDHSLAQSLAASQKGPVSNDRVLSLATCRHCRDLPAGTYAQVPRGGGRKEGDEFLRYEPTEQDVALPFEPPVGAQVARLSHERIEVVQLISWQRTLVRQGVFQCRRLQDGWQRRQAVRAKDEVRLAPFGRRR